ncbi:N-glycosylase/DNA lyase isoform X2 [Brienomyrus brachyistius]|uniref:N-glycosylase/DNA lyase isoform X2 n=1 Tax=Brienomyrus brachyistius TaxID=42636 RepID=UPI0020B17FB9|nr:N-glycosylase/DNA lyase isoform X2 [Brienomyrus brachyistius]
MKIKRNRHVRRYSPVRVRVLDRGGAYPYTARAIAWRSFRCPRSELRLDLTLGCGQTFRWRETADGHWTGVMGGRVWTLMQTEDRLWYHTYDSQVSTARQAGRKWPGQGERLETTKKLKTQAAAVKEEPEGGTQEHGEATSQWDGGEEETLRDYFQLKVSLGELYKEWTSVDHHFKDIANIFTGVRMLRQDPTECLFSFICTSNNHISRIEGMIERLCAKLGAPLCQLDGTAYHDFPTLHALADGSVEASLRDLGFGYRARFLQQSARQILDQHGADWLGGLRSVPYEQARSALRTLPGVGFKVADCVCLMSLDKSCALPVDTHMWQIAQRDYSCTVATGRKTLTDKVYQEIGDFFRKLWGPYAGWAHSVLFCADLKKFQKLKEPPVKMEGEEDEKESKGKTKAEKKHGKARAKVCKT